MNIAKQNQLLDEVRKMQLCGPDDVCYPYYKIMKDGNVAYIARLAFTWGLHLGATVHTSYVNRFCFPILTDAIQAFKEAESIFDVPKSGWVAARPENRLLLPRDLPNFLISLEARKEFVNRHTLPEISDIISDKIYTKNAFDRWLKSEKRTISQCDVGVQEFYKDLPNDK